MTSTVSAETPASPSRLAELHHLRAAGVSLLLDCSGPRLPRVLHWGSDLGPLTSADMATLALAGRPPAVTNSLDSPAPLGILAEAALGWSGTPGLIGHRHGTGFSALFAVRELIADNLDGADAGRDRTLTVHAADDALYLHMTIEIALTPSGLVGLRACLTNTAAVGDYQVDGLQLNLPVPTAAVEILDFTGRHLRERSPQRHGFTVGTHQRDGRRGRTGPDATLLLAAGVPGFGFRGGEVWALHVAWSGNHRTLLERIPEGASLIGGGELLLPGEVRLAPGESYRTPWLYASYGDGLDELSARFHRHLRARPDHPGTPRKVILNTWEAVYFDHDLSKLTELADRAAQVGVERFVLDDGWFRHRRSDRAGLGDWYVDETVWPAGLSPLVDHVKALGMEFGLWVEPEMINPDSDLARAHPDWIMSAGHRLPPTARHQQVLDLTNPLAFEHILERLDTLVAQYGIDYLKWDHNRDLVDAGHPATGEAGVHDQTLATYRLLDILRDRHPHLEIESCSSGGSRVDLGILQRTQRIWASDCIDALERQHIQRWTSLLVPPELIGSHVGGPTAHTTGRTHTLDFRAGTALFGHFGIEWDLTKATDHDLDELAGWIATYQRLRGLLHSGRVVRSDHADPAHWVHGVVADDGSEAIFALVAVATGERTSPGIIQLPGLDPAGHYEIRPLDPIQRRPAAHLRPSPPPWYAQGLRLSGRALARRGFQAPVLGPETMALFIVTRIDELTDRPATNRPNLNGRNGSARTDQL